MTVTESRSTVAPPQPPGPRCGPCRARQHQACTLHGCTCPAASCWALRHPGEQRPPALAAAARDAEDDEVRASTRLREEIVEALEDCGGEIRSANGRAVQNLAAYLGLPADRLGSPLAAAEKAGTIVRVVDDRRRTLAIALPGRCTVEAPPPSPAPAPAPTTSPEPVGEVVPASGAGDEPGGGAPPPPPGTPDLVWEEPPGPRRSGRAWKRLPLADLGPIVENPGRWARVAALPGRRAANQLVVRIRAAEKKGRPHPQIPPGRFEWRAAAAPAGLSRSAVYVRYLGPPGEPSA